MLSLLVFLEQMRQRAFCQCDSLSKALLVVLEVVDATKPADADGRKGVLSMIMAARKEPRLPRG